MNVFVVILYMKLCSMRENGDTLQGQIGHSVRKDHVMGAK